MDVHLFWLADDQFTRLEPYLPTDARGGARVDDRCVISGIVHCCDSQGIAQKMLGPVALEVADYKVIVGGVDANVPVSFCSSKIFIGILMS